MDGTESDEDFSLGPGGEREADEAALRAALHFHVGEICSSETTGKPMTGAAVSTLAEVVFKYTEAMALDLRVFARHAKRAVVGVDDVKCLARKDPKLVEKLAAFEAANLNVGKKKTTRRKKKLSEEESVGVPSVNEDRGDDSTCRRNTTLNRALTTSEGRQPREGSEPGDVVDLLKTDDSEFGGGGASGIQGLARGEGGDSDGDSDDLLI